MLKVVVLCVACMFSSMCSKTQYVGQEERKVGEVHVIVNNGPVDVVLTQGDAPRMVVDGDDVLIEHVITKENDGVLVVSIDPEMQNRVEKGHVRVLVTSPAVNHIENRGPGEFSVKGTLRFEDLNLIVQGPGDVKMTLDGKTLMAHGTGTGDFHLDGRVENQTVTLQGPGDYHGEDLNSQMADVKLYGPGDAYVHVNEQLMAGIFGPGDLFYTGNARVSQHITGPGKVLKR